MFNSDRQEIVMAKKLKRTASTGSGEQLAKQVMDSAQKIWLAGLGAFARAQDEGGKVFDTLVAQGKEIEKKTRQVAGKAVENAKAQASETMGKAAGKWDKLEQVFEDRVHRSLNRLGVVSSNDVEDLTRQVSELSESVRTLIAQAKRGGASKAAPRATVVKATTTAAAKRKATGTARTGVKPAPKVVKKVKSRLK
jgi:poly(hydroxyalkanoate) granule-associated protein